MSHESKPENAPEDVNLEWPPSPDQNGELEILWLGDEPPPSGVRETFRVVRPGDLSPPRAEAPPAASPVPPVSARAPQPPAGAPPPSPDASPAGAGWPPAAARESPSVAPDDLRPQFSGWSGRRAQAQGARAAAPAVGAASQPPPGASGDRSAARAGAQAAAAANPRASAAAAAPESGPRPPAARGRGRLVLTVLCAAVLAAIVLWLMGVPSNTLEIVSAELKLAEPPALSHTVPEPGAPAGTSASTGQDARVEPDDRATDPADEAAASPPPPAPERSGSEERQLEPAPRPTRESAPRAGAEPPARQPDRDVAGTRAGPSAPPSSPVDKPRAPQTARSAPELPGVADAREIVPPDIPPLRPDFASGLAMRDLGVEGRWADLGAPSTGTTAAADAAEDAAAPPPPDPREEAARRQAQREQGVREALRRYQSAYEALDASAVRSVWPGVDVRALERAFGGLSAQRIAFDHCDVRVLGEGARAECTGSATYVPRVGSREGRTVPLQWAFDLARRGDAWTITRAAVW